MCSSDLTSRTKAFKDDFTDIRQNVCLLKCVTMHVCMYLYTCMCVCFEVSAQSPYQWCQMFALFQGRKRDTAPGSIEPLTDNWTRGREPARTGQEVENLLELDKR